MTNRLFRPVTALSLLVALFGCTTETDPSDPTPAIHLSALEVSLTEGAAPETVTVALDQPPTGEVTVTLTATGGILVAPTTLHFTPEDYATPRPVVLSPLDDDDVVASYDTITVAAEGVAEVKATALTTDDDYIPILTTTEPVAFAEGDPVEIGISVP